MHSFFRLPSSILSSILSSLSSILSSLPSIFSKLSKISSKIFQFHSKNTSTAFQALHFSWFTSLIISLSTSLLFLLITFIQFDRYSSYPQFTPWHFAILLATFTLSYASFRCSLPSYILILVFFWIDKILLVYFNLISPVISFPIALVVSLVFARSISAYSFLKSSSPPLLPKKIPFSSHQIPQILPKIFQSPFFIAFVFVQTVILASLVAHHLIQGSWKIVLLLSLLSPPFLFLIFKFPHFKKNLTLFLFLKPFKLIGSFPMAVVNLLSIAFATLITTFIPQYGSVPFQPLSYYIQTFGKIIAQFIFFFQLHDIFHSPWFVALFALLILNIFKVALKKKFSLKYLGFHITHFSIIAIIISSWYNYFLSFQGIIPLVEGQVSNEVQLFDASSQKYKKSKIYLPFNVLLNQFSTQPWKHRYQIYIQKFPPTLPPSISSEFYHSISKKLPSDFLKSLQNAYSPTDKLSLNPFLTFLSSLSLSFLSTYNTHEKHYQLNPNIDPQTQNQLKIVFKMFAFQAKDIAAVPIQIQKPQKILTTDIHFKVLKAYNDYFHDYVPVPTKFQNSVFKNQILSLIPHPIDQQFITKMYSLQNQKWNLSPQIDQSQREKLAHLFSSLDRKALLNALQTQQTQNIKPALGFTLKQLHKPDINSWLTPNSFAQSFDSENLSIQFFWQVKPQNIPKLLGIQKKSSHLIKILRNNKIVSQFFVKPGSSYPLPNSPYQILVSQYYHDFAFNTSTREYFNRSKNHENPALTLNLTHSQKPNKIIPFVLFSKYQTVQAPQTLQAQKISNFQFQYEFFPYKKVALVSATDQSFYLTTDQKSFQKYPLQFDTPYPLGGNPPSFLYFRHLFQDFTQAQVILRPQHNIPESIPSDHFRNQILPQIQNNPQKHILLDSYSNQGKFFTLKPQFVFNLKKRFQVFQTLQKTQYDYPPNNPLIQLQISRDNGYFRQLFLSSKGLDFRKTFPIPDSNYSLTFESRAHKETRFWKSHIIILDIDNQPLPQNPNSVIEVNRFMYYQGYRFYQTDAKKDDPSYSGIGVTKDPGLPFLYSSFVSLALGVLTMFYLPLGKIAKSKKIVKK